MKQLLTILLLLITVSAAAQIPAPMLNTYVNDYANVLTREQVAEINIKLRAMEDSTGVQMAIVIVSQLPPDMVIEQFTLGIGREWKVGAAQNGLVYAFSINDRKQRLEVAKRLEGTIPDVTAVHLQDVTKQYYRSGDYAGGINAFVDGVVEQLKPAAQEQKALTDGETSKSTDETKVIVLAMIILGVGGVFFFIFIGWRDNKKVQEINEENNENSKHILETAGVSDLGKRNSLAYPILVDEIINNEPEPTRREDDSYKSSSNDDDSYSPSKNTDDNNSSSFGNFDSGSPDPGFGGGGGNNNW